ncbi:uncharacterized membrane protein YkvA (DUF1232 family) [Amaricoccus macauensis]|uniref:Uncharacterized membrane protein YkvA (DUF1232 family) n=1 Tax=Amaricoccus macauensis TaxID=57001 RepID=A0A840SXY2_9RHOB|nr:hypothetical protein [Amaricoccus macauensis]MBB5223932.1 uncharacterized membrane protein YkvA (DUF1232 family) [Amaricoccus macauensis]
MRQILPLFIAVAALLLAAGFPRVRWVAAGVVALVMLYIVLKLTGVIDVTVPPRSGVL